MHLPKLKPGDTIGVVCPSYAGDLQSETIKRFEEIITAWGYKILYGKSCYERQGYLAGSDGLRASDITEMFANPDIKAIICLKGGYGASRMVDKIDYEVVKNNPKLLIGFSDVTVLLYALFQQAKLPAIHGQVAIYLGRKDIDDFSLADFKTLLTENTKGRILRNPLGDAKTLVGGVVEGTLIGGNIMLMTNLIGTPYDIDYTDKIVFIEEVHEQPYSIDRMLSQLRLSGKLNQAKGFIFGHFTDCEGKGEKANYQTVEDLITEFFKDCNQPVIYRFASGHAFPFINLPMGLRVKLDADKQEIEILEELYEED